MADISLHEIIWAGLSEWIRRALFSFKIRVVFEPLNSLRLQLMRVKDTVLYCAEEGKCSLQPILLHVLINLCRPDLEITGEQNK